MPLQPTVDPQPRPRASRYSMAWDVVIPIVVAAVPVGAFRLLGLLTRGLDEPGATAPPLVIAAMVVLQTIGIVTMAFVLLARFGQAFSQLHALTDRQPAAWRRCALVLSITCLLLTQILANVGAAFAGAGFLLVAAVPTFLAFLACKGIAFAGLCGDRTEAGEPRDHSTWNDSPASS